MPLVADTPVMPPPFTFLHQVGESAGSRIVRCCDSLLGNGPIGDKQQGALYRYFIGCGLPKPLKGGGDIGTVRTSCAIFAGAVLYWCGSPDRERLRPGQVGWPMFGGWLGSLSRRHPSWVAWTGHEQPAPGAVFYIEHPRNPNNNHVGIFLRELDPGRWTTAEGGGGDGTQCALRNRELEHFDPKWRRELQGWWHPDRLGLEEAA